MEDKYETRQIHKKKGEKEMTEIDIFGIKFNTKGKDVKEKSDYTSKETTYTIPKKTMLEKLGFENEKITYINYDYKKGELTIKVKEQDFLDDEDKEELKRSFRNIG